LTDNQLRFFPRYLVHVDLSHCASCTARRLCKLLEHCNKLQFLALNSCPAAAALFCSEELLGAACAGLRVPCARSFSREFTADELLRQVLTHLELAHNMELDGDVSSA
jgi:hypothetical protein